MATKKKSFEEALARIEEIVNILDNQEVSLDTSVAYYKEGVEIALFCREKLESAQKEVMLLQKKGDGVFTEEPFMPLEDEENE